MHHHHHSSDAQMHSRDLESGEGPVDPRLGPSERPSVEELEQTVPEKLEEVFAHGQKSSSGTEKAISKETTLTEPTYIDFEKGDTRNPVNWSRRKKWTVTLWASGFTILASSCAGSYNMGFPSMISDLDCSEFQATLGLSVYPLGFGIIPLVSASFSEEFGRQPLYLASTLIFGLMYLVIALAQNIQTVIIARFIQGAVGSTGATMVGGTIADVWRPHERGLPMAIFAFAAVGGTGLGPVYGGWIEMNPHLRWRWIQWIQMIICGAFGVFLPFVMKETRSAILLTRLAKKMRKGTGDNRIRARVEDERASLRTLIYISCTRPLYLLCTEPIVMAFSLWIGFAWGVIYAAIESIGTVFRTLHSFNSGQIGTTFLTMVVGTSLGFATIMYQERLYRKYFPKKGIEARLYPACLAAILLPVGLLIYAWCSFPWVHWMALIIGLTTFMWASFMIYHTVFTYLADCYGPFASSALAAQSLFRNILGTVFPLFIQQMLHNLTFKWAGTLIAMLALLLLPIPFFLYVYGPAIRERSKFSRAVMDAQAR
ncbi:hypothetical protein HGRIS_004846 [Hohenbuehelia grisea]|uniref:Major facilitator superfamily (MFS) profile domain-containing protein n=1 Tax=Hohenbuehelia grisea TaxID=104357 RepID=A0ABR3JE01_9AGAR